MHSQAQCFLTSNIFLSQLTQHYVFMDKFFLQSRSNPWEYHLASNETRFLKQDQPPPEQKRWVRATSRSTVPCTSPQHTCPSTHAQLLAALLFLLPTDSSTVTLATAELLGSQAVCPRQMPTCHYLETPESLGISSQVPLPHQVLMHFCLFLAFNCFHGVLGSGWQPSGSVLSAHLSA